MKGRSRLALSVLSLALACEGAQQTTGPNAPLDPSKIIQDGAHGGNKDFFFLPPMVPLPLHNPYFQLGKFNNALRPSLRVDICELDGLHLHPTLGVPTDQTKCLTGVPLKKQFLPGTVRLVNLPLRQNGWWSLFGLPADGFYYVLWDTSRSNLDVSKFYRISVFVEGKPDALGVADVDPMSSLRQWKYSLTGEVIQLIDDVMLPITFRVEQGALCEGGTCASATYSNISTTPLQVLVETDGPGTSTAGALIQPGSLPLENSPGCTPATCPQTVVINITRVPAGAIGLGLSAASTLCHPDIAQLEQFEGCYNFSTTPELRRLNLAGDQFIKDVLVAVCFELEGSVDAREKFAQLYSSGPDEPSKWLDDKPEGTLIGALTKDCTPPVSASRSSNPLIQFASSGWRTLKGGLSSVFGIKTAYAIDLGLGGLTKGFSHISPVLRVGIAPASFTDVTLPQGAYSTNVSAKIIAEHFHTEVAPGVNDVPVTFSVTEGNGTIKLVTNEGAGSTAPITVNTAALPAGVTLNGFASVTWILPPDPGTYTMTADGPGYGGPIIYSATVPALYEPWFGTGSVASAGPVAFGGTPYCNYTVEFTNIQFDMALSIPSGGGGDVTFTQTERLANPCGDILPLPPHLDVYGSIARPTRTGNSVTAVMESFGNPIRAGLTFVGTMSEDQETLSGTFTWHRLDQLSPLDWTVVVPATITRAPPPTSLTPVLEFTGSEFYTAGGSNWVRYKLGVTNYRAYPPVMFAPRPDLPPCGLNTNASRTWVDIYNASTNTRIYGFCALGRPFDLNSIWFAKPVGTAPPSQVYIKLTDRATGSVYQSNPVTPVQPL